MYLKLIGVYFGFGESGANVGLDLAIAPLGGARGAGLLRRRRALVSDGCVGVGSPTGRGNQ
jgi:hypothetical protein